MNGIELDSSLVKDFSTFLINSGSKKFEDLNICFKKCLTNK